MKYLITASLLNNFSWFHKIANETKEMEFKQSISKEKLIANEYMQAGIKFENDVRMCIESIHQSEKGFYENCVREVAAIVRGGTWQVKGYCDIQIGDVKFFLYGIADVLKGPYIYDIKFVKKYEYGKYQDSSQHKIYFRLFPKALGFHYLISDGNNVYTEYFGRDQSFNLESEISDFWSWINNNPDYSKIYFEKWKAL